LDFVISDFLLKKERSEVKKNLKPQTHKCVLEIKNKKYRETFEPLKKNPNTFVQN